MPTPHTEAMARPHGPSNLSSRAAGERPPLSMTGYESDGEIVRNDAAASGRIPAYSIPLFPK